MDYFAKSYLTFIRVLTGWCSSIDIVLLVRFPNSIL